MSLDKIIVERRDGVGLSRFRHDAVRRSKARAANNKKEDISMKEKIEALILALDDALSLRIGMKDMEEVILRISSLKGAIHDARKSLSQIAKEKKQSESTIYAEILADTSLRNAEARKNALEQDKGSNSAYQALVIQEQDIMDIIAEKEARIETETNRFKALCINAEQQTAIINALSAI